MGIEELKIFYPGNISIIMPEDKFLGFEIDLPGLVVGSEEFVEEFPDQMIFRLDTGRTVFGSNLNTLDEVVRDFSRQIIQFRDFLRGWYFLKKNNIERGFRNKVVSSSYHLLYPGSPILTYGETYSDALGYVTSDIAEQYLCGGGYREISAAILPLFTAVPGRSGVEKYMLFKNTMEWLNYIEQHSRDHENELDETFLVWEQKLDDAEDSLIMMVEKYRAV